MVLEVAKGRNTFHVILGLWIFEVRRENGELRNKVENCPAFLVGHNRRKGNGITRARKCARSAQNVFLPPLVKTESELYDDGRTRKPQKVHLRLGKLTGR